MTQPRIHHLFISPGHNFVGHHGEAAGTNPTLEVDQVECVAGHGLRGDRYFDHKHDYKGQITLISWEYLVALWEELDVPEAQRNPGATRRNIVVEDMDLPSLIGREFELQGVMFRGSEDCSPCSWMNRAVYPGAEAWLRKKGGLRARILTDGFLRRDVPPGA